MDYLHLLATVVVVYGSWRLLKLLLYFLREYFVLWVIMRGGGREGAAVNKKRRLYAYMAEIEYLDEVSGKELYNYLLKMLDSEASYEEFHKVLKTYKYVVTCRDKMDGSLRGVGLAGVERRDLDGYKYTIVRVGLTFLEKSYQGSPILYYMIAYLLLKEMILHPLTPLYTIGKSFTYKSYLLTCHAFPYGYPRYDKETPPLAKKIINEFARSVMTSSDVYDEETFVLKREKVYIKPGTMEISAKDLEDPHIKFFVERNPGWTKGHQLLNLGQVRWKDILGIIWKSMVRSRPGSKHKQPQKEDFHCYRTAHSRGNDNEERLDHTLEDRYRHFSE